MAKRRKNHAGRHEGQQGETRSMFVPGSRLFDGGRLGNWLANNQRQGVNVSLLFQKYARWSKVRDSTRNLTGIDMSGSDSRETNSLRRQHLKDVAGLTHTRPQDYEVLKERYFFDQRYSFVRKTSTRLLVGFAGTGSVFENSILLHPLYGFPMIHGSSLKGLARSYCVESGVGADKLLRMFGNEPEKEGREGEVVFMDAWPEEWPERGGLLELDVMTPHYGRYYRKVGPPADNDSPNPIVFLAVPAGIRFCFCLHPSRTCKEEDIVREAKDYLILALEKFGVGAKTGSSYGYFVRTGTK